MFQNCTSVTDAELFDRLIEVLPSELVDRLKGAAARCALRHPSVFLTPSSAFPLPLSSFSSQRQTPHLRLVSEHQEEAVPEEWVPTLAVGPISA
jgi:hypothetical protein